MRVIHGREGAPSLGLRAMCAAATANTSNRRLDMPPLRVGNAARHDANDADRWGLFAVSLDVYGRQRHKAPRPLSGDYRGYRVAS